MPYATYMCSAEGQLAAAGTGQLLDPDADGATFTAPISELFLFSDLDCYVSPVASQVGQAATGGADARVFVKGGIQYVLPWHGDKVYFLNAVTSQQPTIHVSGPTARQA